MAGREICICIATYLRPRQLKQLLASLVEQQEAPPFEVVVVDNDAGGSAEPVVAEFRERLSLSYSVEPVRGLARVRNRAVTASTAKFLAFVDDDEWVSPMWLAAHYRVATQMNAGAVIGPVDFLFDKEVPDFIRTCGLFNRRRYADGEVMPLSHTSTNNCFVRRDALPHPTAPFSTSFDLTGGEDIHLFRRMIDDGVRIVAASQARVFEHRAASRANLSWILRRAFRNGGTIVEVDWKPCDWVQRVRRTVDASVEGVRHAARAGRHWRRDKTLAVQNLMQACEEFGKVLRQLGIRIEEYRHYN
jgi:succinoglycan biosynthesis protein ExoM